MAFGLVNPFQKVYNMHFKRDSVGKQHTLTTKFPRLLQVRRTFRPYFLGSRCLKLGYDILTWATTQLTICYTVMPFLLLAVESTLIYYRYVLSLHFSHYINIIMCPMSTKVGTDNSVCTIMLL